MSQPENERAPARQDPTGTAGVGDGLMSAAKIDNYRSARGAAAYYEDHQSKVHRRLSDRRERRILGEFLARCAAARGGGKARSLLDCPCGYGRMLGLFREHAEQVVEADFSPTMLALAEELHGGLASAYLQCSALAVPRPDRAFDTVVSIRLNHHLDSADDRRTHVRELCRVSADAVILTFFSSQSLKNRLRRLRALWNGKRAKNTLAPAEVRELFAGCGFAVECMVPLARIGSGHLYVLARRQG
jgi:SAM-dependent methyltransferase